MEAIKVNVEVSVNLSENTQNFIKSLLACSCSPEAKCQTPIPTVPDSASPRAVSAYSASSAPAVARRGTARVSAPATSEAQTPATSEAQTPATSEAQAPTKTIEDIRTLVVKKVMKHREAIKRKLNEFDTPSVTALDPSHYNEMFTFLEAL